jgi:chemotaxis protein methyltransferase CheR
MPDAGALKISSRDFQHLSSLVRERFGLVLESSKEQMVTARLSKRLRELNYSSFGEYYRHVTSDASGAALKDMVDALTTKFTSFFREPEHFELLRMVAAEQGHAGPVRVWSAACATGEEPYSIAITLLETLGYPPARDIEILASDVSSRALERAWEGLYQAEQVATVPRLLARKYFLKGEGKWNGWFRVKPEVRKLIEFRQINLMDALPAQTPFSVIFCRNVMIYFDCEGQESVVNRLVPFIEPNGYLFIGHAEGLAGVRHPLRYLQPAVYKRVQGRGK